MYDTLCEQHPYGGESASTTEAESVWQAEAPRAALKWAST